MSVTYPVRNAVKSLLLANLVQPSEPDGDLAIFNSPEDDNPDLGPIRLESFPTIIVQKGLYGETDTWQRVTQIEDRYQWWLEIIVYLAEEKLPSWQAQKLVEDWQTAVANVLLAEPTLNGTIEHIIQGDNREFMYSRDGFFDWFTQDSRNPDSYWGIGFRMQVAQAYSYAENVGVSL